jgi:ketosteroid isomerase-like protein
VSQENIEIVRRLVAALNDADVDLMVGRFYTQDAEFAPAVQAALEGTVYRGSDQIRAYYREIYGVWDKLRVSLEHVTDVGDSVLATGSVTLRGKSSGAELVAPWTFLFELADGKVRRQRNFIDRAEALRAVGLEE